MSQSIAVSDDLTIDLVVSFAKITLTVLTTPKQDVILGIGLYHMRPSIASPKSVGRQIVVAGSRPVYNFDDLRPGPYVLILSNEKPAPNYHGFGPSFDPSQDYIPLWVDDGTGKHHDAKAEVDRIITEQLSFTSKDVGRVAFNSRQFRVDVILEGCQLDYAQRIEGGYVVPIQYGVGPASLFEALNRVYLQEGMTFTSDAVFLERYQADRPLSAISFTTVSALNLEEAIRLLQPRIDAICAAFAVDRSADPIPLAFVTRAFGEQAFRLTPVPKPYRGNLLGGFLPGAVTELLDIIQIASTKDPWISFALNLYREAMRENSEYHQLFKAWSLLEAAAKRTVSKSNVVVMDEYGKGINYRGRALTLQNNLGRTLVYARDVSKAVPALHMGTTHWSATEQLTLAYQIRNRVAHEGGIPDYEVVNMPPSRLKDFISLGVGRTSMDWATNLMRYETYRASI